MSQFCLTLQAKQRFRDALKNGEITPDILAGFPDSLSRRNFLAKYVGPENAIEVNGLFESKLLLKNQKAGIIAAVKKVLGLSPQVRRDMITQAEKLTEVLTPSQLKDYYRDVVNAKLKIDIPKEQYDQIIEMTKKEVDLKNKWLENIKENKDTLDEYLKSNPKEKLEYGMARVNLNNYISDIQSGDVSIKGLIDKRADEFKTTYETNKVKAVVDYGKDTVNTIGDNVVASLASLDNSFLGRQGLYTLFTSPEIWANAAKNSYKDYVETLGNKVAKDALMASIYSDPEYIDGTYQKAGILPEREEQFPTSLPGRIPGAGRFFKASEAAFEGSAIRMRTDLYKKISRMNIENGVDMKNPEEIKSLGIVINSLTGKGSWGAKGTPGALKLVLWAPNNLKASFDVITAHTGQNITPSARKLARTNLLKIVGSIATVMLTAYALDPKSVEFDSTSSDFGDLKIGKNHETRVVISGNAKSLVVLASRLALGHYKSTNGQIVQYGSGYGQKSRFDAVLDFLSNKTNPLAGSVVDYLKGKNFNGQTPTISNEIYSRTVPLTVQNLINLKDGASVDKIAGVILDFHGLNSQSYLDANIKSGIISENTKISNKGMVNQIALYAKAMGTDPETAFNRIFTGQEIVRVDNGTVIVKRMSLSDSTKVKKDRNGNNPRMKLDHTVSLELGGSNSPDNLRLVTTSEWASYTKVENALGRAIKNNKINKNDAKNLIIKFKGINNSSSRKDFGQKIINKYQ